MDGWTDRFSCFTEIFKAESKNRAEPCAYKNESSDIEKHISSKKKPWYTRDIQCK